MVDALDLGSSIERCRGSSPLLRTLYNPFFNFLEVKLETKYNKLSECNYEVVISVPYNDMTGEFEEAYAKERKEIAYPGFRKGKVPMSIMKRVFKNDIEMHAAEKKSEKFIEEAIKSSSFQTLNKPILKDIKINENIEYFVDIEIIPELELKDYKNNDIEKKNYVIADSYIENVIKDISKKDAAFEQADVITDKSFIAVVDAVEVEKYNDEDFALLEDMERAHFDLESAVKDFKFEKGEMGFDISSPGIKNTVSDLFIDKKVDDVIVVNEKHEHGEGEHKHSHESTVKLKIKKIFKIVYSELTEEKIEEYSNKKSKTIEEFRTLIAEDYKKYYSKLAEDEARNALIAKVLENNQFELPTRFTIDTLNMLIQKQRKEMGNKYPNVSDDTLADALYPRALQQVQW